MKVIFLTKRFEEKVLGSFSFEMLILFYITEYSLLKIMLYSSQIKLPVIVFSNTRRQKPNCDLISNSLIWPHCPHPQSYTQCTTKATKQWCPREGNECLTGADTWHLAITVLPSSCHGCTLLMSRASGRHAENSPLWFAEDITCELRCPSAISIPEGHAAPEIPSCIFNEKLERYLIVTLLTCSQSMCFVITLTYLTSNTLRSLGIFRQMLLQWMVRSGCHTDKS